ncbi:hypothetical protein L486_06013 [Kwoniella mangroviensis CBS 10435]|uniref:Uncharacterized protein n=1 Tax=Kwoniella mangroviensis CBS 10435 TaxID=1331196 RepID=A0A1B9IKJ7_9TREE|nr:hypothetical protein L486_06013 [Kwoniella mangroviensis CBS 10435]
MSAGNRMTVLSTTRPPRSISYTSSAARFNLQVTNPQGQREYMWKTSMMNSRVQTTNAQGAYMWGNVEAAMAAQGIRGDLQNDVKLDVSEALSFYHAGRNPQS